MIRTDSGVMLDESSSRAGFRIVLCLVALMLACALPYPFTTLILDATRDLVMAARIAQGEQFPAQGPVINAVAHLGPAWFYLLAPVIGLSKSVATTLFFIGVLDALKFPLAFAIGRRLGGVRLGLWAALAMAFPNWAIGAGLLVTHTSVVQTLVLAAVLAALRLEERDSPARWALLGLAQGLVLHAHPATLVLFPLLFWLMWRRRHRPWVNELRGWVLAAFMAWLPFAPMLIDEAMQGWPISQRWSHYSDSHALGNPVAIAIGSLFGGATLLSDHLAGGAWQWVLRLTASLGAAAGLAGLSLSMRDPSRRVAVLACVFTLLLAVLGLALLRERTPFYMSLMLWPAAAGLLALGWEALADSRPMLRVFIAGSVVSLVVAETAFPLLRAAQGLVSLPTAALFDVAAWRVAGDTKALLPAVQLDRLGVRICERNAPVVLHAELGTLFDSALGLSSRLQCANAAAVRIGGGAIETADHRLGLPPLALKSLGLAEDPGWSAAMRTAAARVIAGPRSLAIPDGSRYPFREQAAGPIAEHEWEFEADPDEVVLLTTPFRPYDGAERLTAYANDAPQAPAFESYATAAYRCADCTAPVRWRLKVRTGFPERVDIVTARAEPH